MATIRLSNFRSPKPRSSRPSRFSAKLEAQNWSERGRRRGFLRNSREWPKSSKLYGNTNFGPKFPNFSLKPFSVTNFPENIFLYRILRNFRISRQNHFLTQILRKTCFCTEFCEISEFHEISEKCVSEPKFPCFLNVGLKTRRAAYIYIARIVRRVDIIARPVPCPVPVPSARH